MKRWLKSLFNLDALWATVVLYILMFTVPLLFVADVFTPFVHAIEDIQISDIYYSSIMQGDDEDDLGIPMETEIVVINAVTFSDFGQKDLSTENLARFVLMAQDAGAMAVGVNAEIEFDTQSEDYLTMLEIFGQDGVLLAKDKVTFDGVSYSEYKAESEVEKELLEGLRTRKTDFIGSDNQKHTTIRSFVPVEGEEGSGEKLHFGLELAKAYNAEAVERIVEADREETVINFRGNYDKFQLLEATEFFSGAYVETYGEDFLQNKIVLIGDFDQSGVSDEFEKIYYTPMNEETDGRTFPDMYETLILANITSMAISNTYLDIDPVWKNYLIGFLLAYINMLIYIYISKRDRKWLEFVSLILFVVQSSILAWLTIVMISEWNEHDDLTFLIFVAALAPIVFQLFMDTVRPLARRLLNLFS